MCLLQDISDLQPSNMLGHVTYSLVTYFLQLLELPVVVVRHVDLGYDVRICFSVCV